jgi:hypothetical protein
MVDVCTDTYPVSPHSRLYWTQLQFNSNEEFSYLGMDNSSPDAAGLRFRSLILQAAEECRHGAGFDFTIQVTIGRKP